MNLWLRSLLFCLPPSVAHALAMAALAPLERVAPLRSAVRTVLAPSDPRLCVNTMGLSFPSPVGLAGGFDKDAKRARALSALGFGFLELGTVTTHAQKANPPPNLFRLPQDRALINRLGFPNDGAAQVADRLKKRGGAEAVGVPVGVSIGKSRAIDIANLDAVIADYRESMRAARSVAQFIVVNVSSPNTANLRSMQQREMARALLSALRSDMNAGPRVPLLLKISPDLNDEELESLLEVVALTELDGVIATNTTLSRDGLQTPPKEVHAIGAGGLSGAPLHNRAREMVYRTRSRLGAAAVIVGVGGVDNGQGAYEMFRAGADLVQLYTGFVYRGPLAAFRIHRELLQILEREKVAHVSELVRRG